MSTREQFINQLDEKFPNRDFEIVGDYINARTKILLENEYGQYLIQPRHLAIGIRPSINSCLDKNRYFIEKARSVHGDKYDYSRVIYVNARTKIEIECNFCRVIFQQKPSDHLRGSGCSICGILKNIKVHNLNTEEWIKKAKIIHDNKYDYSLVEYVNAKSKVKIICTEKDHGVFEIIANNHLNGRGCQKCGRLRAILKNGENSTGWLVEHWIESANQSKNFDSFKVYIIRCWNDKEEFHKIGRTYKLVESRFSNSIKMPYNWQLILQFESTSNTIYNLENKLKSKYKNFKYLPSKQFNGKQECFSIKLPIAEIISLIEEEANNEH